jgi:hypothetical protein
LRSRFPLRRGQVQPCKGRVKKALGRFLVSASAATSAAATSPAITATATAASTAAGTSASAAATTTGPAALWSGSSFVHIYGPAFHFLAVQAGNPSLGLGLGGHFHKSESSGFAAELISYDIDRTDLAESLESLTQIIFCCVV